VTLTSLTPYLKPAEPDSKRPIVFICHSLGGIILKTVLVKANEQRTHYQFIFEHPKAVIFMATPHLGSDMATFFDRFTKLPVPNFVMDKTNIRLLKSHSLQLLDLTNRFVERVDEFKAIVFFYETKRHPNTKRVVCINNPRFPEPQPFATEWVDLGCQVVDEHSATLRDSREQRFPLSADHHSICKFESTNDPKYTLVLGLLKNIIGKSLDVNLNVRAPPAIRLRLEAPDSFTTPSSSRPPSAYPSPYGAPRTRSYKDIRGIAGPIAVGRCDLKLPLGDIKSVYQQPNPSS
jgi:hypothetical protein